MLQDPDAITGMNLPRKAYTQHTDGPLSGWLTSMISLASDANRGRAKGLCRHARAAADDPDVGFFKIRSAAPQTVKRGLRGLCCV